jgi:hypothetical protein
MSPLTMGADVIPPAAPASWLFVEDAAGGTITGPDDQHLKLKLNKVRKYITEFTDRPIRQADAVPNADFFTAWPQMFAGDPPNAVLSYSLPGQPQPLNIVLTLTYPQYDALKRTVSYDAVRILQATDIYLDNPDLAPFQTHKTPSKFGKASLFIDDATYAVGGTGPNGGIIFYLDDTGIHGLEAATADASDASSGVHWGCMTKLVGGIGTGTGTGLGTGQENTNLINSKCPTLPTAASVAAGYNNGSSGWYLPSLDESAALINSKVITLTANEYYWTSSEASSTTAYDFPDTLSPYYVTMDKKSQSRVRPIHTF